MQINFTQVLQDSWNFFRNQQKIMLQFVAILFIVQSASALLSFPVNDENKNDVLNLAKDSFNPEDVSQKEFPTLVERAKAIYGTKKKKKFSY